jgi:N-methylhydantoinase A
MVRVDDQRLADAWSACQETFAPLERAGLEALEAEGFAVGKPDGSGRPVRFGLIESGLDIRYVGQSFELTVPLAGRHAVESLGDALTAFHVAHETRYGYARADAPVEIVNVRLTARGVRPKPDFAPAPAALTPDPGAARIGEAPMRCRGRWVDAAVYHRDRLRYGHELAGPALIVQEDATTVLLPGWRARVDGWLNLVAEEAHG